MSMKISGFLNLILVAVILVGVYFWYPLQIEQQRLEKEHASLSLIYGDFSEEQKSLPQVIPLESNDPMVFRWRVYLPAGYIGELKNNQFRWNIGIGMPWNHPAEFLITQTFEVRHKRKFGARMKSIYPNVDCITWAVDQYGPVNYRVGGGRGGRPVGLFNKSEFLVDHWNELGFKVFEASEKPITTGEFFNLLDVKIPEKLSAEYIAQEKSNPGKGSVAKLDLRVEKVN